MVNTNIQLTDINPGKPKTIAVNYLFEKNEYFLNGWTTELSLYSVSGVTTAFDAVIRDPQYSTFYLSTDETKKLGQLVDHNSSEIIQNKKNKFYYEINLVKDYSDTKRQIPKSDEIKILLCSGSVSIEDVKNER